MKLRSTGLLGAALCISWAGNLAAATFALSPSAALEKIAEGDQTIETAHPDGGFSAMDGASKKSIDLAKGKRSKRDDVEMFDADEVDGIKLHAEFAAQQGYVLVSGYVESVKPEDRAIVLEYRVGLEKTEGIFSNSLSAIEDKKLSATSAEIEGNAYPIATLTTGERALALAIPPDDPRIFGMVGSAHGLSVRFYLGVSPVTERFPNRAAFRFIIYPSDATWGFRSALEKYYSFYPERYKLRTKKDGLWLFQVKGIVPENIKQYGFNVLEMQSKDVESDLARDATNGVGDMVYTLEGQREIKFLDTLPKNYAEAMQAFDHWTYEQAKAHPMTKENTPAGGDIWLKEEVTNSACKDFSGKYAIQLRTTPWGRKSVSFKVNPSPYIYADQDLHTVGKDSLELIDSWIKKYSQIGGVLLDSYGANWPAVLDYRRDHFKYAQYPLTFDPDGRLAIHNDTGHYEFAWALRQKLDPSGRLLFANGVYAYKTSVPEHYRAKDLAHRVKVGRFFDAALFDGGSSEVGSKIDVERCQDVRVFMGRKYYAVINYQWDDPVKLDEFFNRCLCFDLFASNTKFYPPGEEYVEGGNEGISYVDSPAGYLRDKDLLNWFVPKARLLHQAGWEPVTRAHLSSDKGIHLERYGNGNTVYFTVFNDSKEKKTCEVEIDLQALGFTEGVPDFKELAQNVEPELVTESRIKLTLEPYKTYIISMGKPWLVGMLE